MQAVVKATSGELVGMVDLDQKTFKTGSRGYHGNGKITVDGKRYQANFMLIEIGSKKEK